jgi:ribosomal protein S18 acetylase RimI-like enzyme
MAFIRGVPESDHDRVRLRPTLESDLDFVLALEMDDANSPFVGSWSREEHRAAIEAQDRQHWIVERVPEGRRVGYLIGMDLRAAGLGAHLKRIVVSEKGQGIGRAATALFAQQAFAKLQPDFVWLDVLEHNERAQAAYRAAGFRSRKLSDVEYHTWAAAVGGFEKESVVMVCTPTVKGR